MRGTGGGPGGAPTVRTGGAGGRCGGGCGGRAGGGTAGGPTTGGTGPGTGGTGPGTGGRGRPGGGGGGAGRPGGTRGCAGGSEDEAVTGGSGGGPSRRDTLSTRSATVSRSGSPSSAARRLRPESGRCPAAWSPSERASAECAPPEYASPERAGPERTSSAGESECRDRPRLRRGDGASRKVGSAIGRSQGARLSGRPESCPSSTAALPLRGSTAFVRPARERAERNDPAMILTVCYRGCTRGRWGSVMWTGRGQDGGGFSPARVHDVGSDRDAGVLRIVEPAVGQSDAAR